MGAGAPCKDHDAASPSAERLERYCLLARTSPCALTSLAWAGCGRHGTPPQRICRMIVHRRPPYATAARMPSHRGLLADDAAGFISSPERRGRLLLGKLMIGGPIGRDDRVDASKRETSGETHPDRPEEIPPVCCSGFMRLVASTSGPSRLLHSWRDKSQPKFEPDGREHMNKHGEAPTVWSCRAPSLQRTPLPPTIESCQLVLPIRAPARHCARRLAFGAVRRGRVPTSDEIARAELAWGLRSIPAEMRGQLNPTNIPRCGWVELLRVRARCSEAKAGQPELRRSRLSWKGSTIWSTLRRRERELLLESAERGVCGGGSDPASQALWSETYRAPAPHHRLSGRANLVADMRALLLGLAKTNALNILALHGGGGMRRAWKANWPAFARRWARGIHSFTPSGPSSYGGLWIRDPPGGKENPTTDPNWASASFAALDALVSSHGPFD